MTTLRLVAVVKAPGSVPALLEFGDAVHGKWLLSPLLSGSTNPTLPAFKNNLDALRTSQSVKGTGTAAVEARNNARKQVRRDLENLRIFAQQAADANEAQAAAIITAAGMTIKKVTVHHKPDFAIYQGATAGTAIARAKSRGRGATYWWEVSSDAKTWVGGLPTRIAKTTFTNLTPGTTYYFRFQVLTKAGMSDWSQVITFIVK